MRNTSCPCSHPCHSYDENSLVMKHGTAFRFGPGELLWREGDVAHELVAVCTGHLLVTLGRDARKDPLVDLVARGGMLGFAAVETRGRRLHTVVAGSAGRAMRLDADDAQRLLRRDASAARACVYGQLCAMRRMSEWRKIRETGSAAQRIASAVLHLADHLGLNDARGTFVPIHLTRSELGRLVGCRDETVTRRFTAWADFVTTTREGMVISDRDALEAIVRGEEPLRAAG